MNHDGEQHLADPFGEQLLSVPMAAKRCGISATLLHELIDANAIPYFTPHKQRRVRSCDVLRFINSRQTAAKVKRPANYVNYLAD